MIDVSVDLVVSSYCFHHLDADGKERALAEALRLLEPGGRIVFGDMMFGVHVQLVEREGGGAIATRPALLRSARAVDARVAWRGGHRHRARDVDRRPDGAGDQADR